MKLAEILRMDYFRYQLLAWRFSGSFELSEGNYLSLALFWNIVVYLPTPMAMAAMFSFDDPLENNYNFIMSITSQSNLVKFLLYVTQLTKLIEIQRIIEQLDARVTGMNQLLRHEKMSKHMQRMSRLFVITYGIVFINAAVPFIFETERSLPLPMWFPFDWRNSTVAYIAALALQEIGILFQIIINCAADSFPPLALFLVTEQGRLLSLRISQIGYGPSTLKENEQDLVKCIEDQNMLYGLLDLIQAIISYPMMVQFLAIGINIATNLFGLVFYVESLYDRLLYVCYLVALIVETFPLCYYGTKVEESFAELHYAVFCSNWVEQSAQYRGFMLILEERTKRQQLLLAGNLVPIHLSTFVACLKGSYSFFTLMVNRSGRGS
ncbi:odorant receptor 23a-like [Drosophila takahashii]|uniref:odorant receptor 23a-like n=1 Tax=Drosophila takahashii TaxID=29030 RepID=UPI0038995C3F